MADEAQIVEVVEPAVVKTGAAEVLQQLENEVLEHNLRVCAAAARFAEIDPKNPEVIPFDWVAQYGLERAREMHRVACAAWMSAKEAPVGLAMAKSVVGAAVKAHAERSVHIGNLNIGRVMIVGGDVDFPRMIVE